jgi:uncharacterized protein YhaN
MKFEEIYIDGFGIFHNYSIKKLNQGLNIIIGPNEAGKSTIHTFQKRILFGFPDKRSKQNPYPALAGGNHGGRLVITSRDNKRFIIERYSEERGVNVVFPDGSSGSDVELLRLLGHANENIYNSIYAFGLSELQNFETLNSEEVRDRLYSAGTGIGASSLSEIQKKIERDAGELFKERGSTPILNTLFRNIKEIDSQLREIGNNVQKFDELNQKFDTITATIKTIEEERNKIRSELSHTKNLVTLWDDWLVIQDSNEKLKQIPEIKDFPEKGMELLDKYIVEIERLNDEITKKNENFKKIKVQKSQIKIDEKLIKNKDKIIELQKGEDKYNSAFKDLPRETERLESEKNELKTLLREIGPEWNEEKLVNFDFSIPTKEEVRKKDKVIKEIEKEIQNNKKDVQNLKKNSEKIENKLKELDKIIKAQSQMQLDEKKLKQEKTAVQLLRAKYPSLKETQANINNLQEKEELFSLLKPKLEFTPKYPIWPMILLMISGIISLIILFLENNLFLGVILFGVLSISGVIYVILSRDKILFTSIDKGKDAEIDDLSKKSKGLAETRNKLTSELHKINAEMLKAAEILGFESIPDPHILESKDAELQTSSEQLLQLNELKKQYNTLQQEFEKYCKETDEINKAIEKLNNDRTKVYLKWKTWLTEREINPELTAEGIIEIFATIKTSLEKKKLIEDIASRLERMEKYLKEYTVKITSILKDCNRKIKQKEINVLGEIGKLTDDLKKVEEENNTIKQLIIDEEKNNVELNTLQTKLDEQQKLISQLLSDGSAKSENEFRENASNWAERNKLTNAISQVEHNIKRIFGEGKPYSDCINEFKSKNPEILKEQELQLDEKLREKEENLSKLREERGGINTEIKQIEQQEEASKLRMERNIKLKQLQEKSKDWAILILAKTIIRKAIEKYERERQPGVIKESQSFFSKMTLSRYSRIYAPLDEPTKIYVEDKDGRKKDIFELSRGTAEQLYLSLRFGFIREFGKKAESLPIIFDDILVNFDPERFKVACNAIKELTTTNQVLFYTCHPDIAESLFKLVPDSKIYKIS